MGFDKKYAFQAEFEIGAGDTTKEVLTLLFNNRDDNLLFKWGGPEEVLPKSYVYESVAEKRSP
jgi:hypothetical protein